MTSHKVSKNNQIDLLPFNNRNKCKGKKKSSNEGSQNSGIIKYLGGKPILDRFIPNQTCHKAYKESPNMQNFDVALQQLIEPSIQVRLPSPEFFTSSDLPIDQLLALNDSTTISQKKKLKLNQELKSHRQYMADALGFKSSRKVFQFNKINHSVQDLPSSPNHSRVDPLLSILPIKDAALYVNMQEFSYWKKYNNFVGIRNRPKKRAKSIIPYRVLDAPALRNDFYSNLVDWSRTTNNVVVGLNCSVYLWSDSIGAISILHHKFLQKLSDLVTCVSFAPLNNLLVIGTKYGRVMVFDQLENSNILPDGSRKPLCEYRLSGKRSICCISWFQQTTKREFLIGNDIGEVYKFRIVDITRTHHEIITMKEAKNKIKFSLNGNISTVESFKDSTKLVKDSLVKFTYETCHLYIENCFQIQAQTQQVCGFDINKETNQLAIGGNDNSCTIWKLFQDENTLPQLQFTLNHKAAVKAVAFCPWSKSLLATGGGSKDRCIRFWHSHSGTLLKEMETPGQITSLVWSTRKRQIMATFGFSDLDNPMLITTYSYPALESLVEVKASNSLRVLSSATSPDFSSVCVATNDETVRFYELWNSKDSTIIEAQTPGILESNIIESEEGIEKQSNEIR